MIGLARADLQLRIETTGVRRILYEPDGTAERARTVERTLRTAQNFHVVEVRQPQVEKQRSFIHVGGHRWNDGRGEGEVARLFAVQATNDERAAGDTAV